MDWSKAKNIIIAVLLAANVLIGGNLLAQHSREQAQARQATENAYAFLEQAGMQVDAQLPDQEKKLPVLFLRLHKAGEKAVLGAHDEHRGKLQTLGAVHRHHDGAGV